MSRRREPAYQALLGLLQAMKDAGTIKTVSRKLVMLPDCSPSLMPAVYLQIGKQRIEQRASVPPKRTFGALLYVYVAAPNDKVPSGPVLNNLLDDIEDALDPPAYSDRQTLGGVVVHAWIEGTIATYEATTTQSAAALIPINMLLP